MTTDPAPGGAAPGPASRAASIVQSVALSPVGSRRVETTLARLMSVFGLLFGLQSVFGLVGGWHAVATPLGLAQVVLVEGTLALAGLAALLEQWTRTVFTVAAAAFLVALATWPVVARPLPAGESPWLLSLSGVACGFVVVASRSWRIPVGYTVAVALWTVLVRTSSSGGGAPLGDAALAAGSGVVVALALLAIAVAVRRAARAVDHAQTAALGRYADAQIDEATEAERTRTDALVHDSVLTTFLSAASAPTPQAQVLAARMARNAMNVLSRATVASHIGPKVAVQDLLDRVRTEAAAVGEGFAFAIRDVRDHFVPEPVADAVVLAAVQAMTNSVKHAGGPEVPRRVVVEGVETGGVRVLVEDRGSGFDPDRIASERLGVRVSIFERMRLVGGEVQLSTALGRGTTFALHWPAAAQAQTARAGDEAVVGA